MYAEKAELYGCDASIVHFQKYEKYYKNDVDHFGISKITPIEVKKYNFEEFAHSRHSSRIFDGRSISDEQLDEVVKLAQTAPSACNRQSAKIMHVKDRELAKKILKIQGGAKGHSDSDVLLLISDLSLYRYSSEMFTPYLDGGIFLMNLLYALHYYGLGACPLIWDDYGSKGVEIRKILDIPKNFHIVAVLQVGFVPENACYALSKRREADIIV